jgi:hypothetical protein
MFCIVLQALIYSFDRLPRTVKIVQKALYLRTVRATAATAATDAVVAALLCARERGDDDCCCCCAAAAAATAGCCEKSIAIICASASTAGKGASGRSCYHKSSIS